MYGNRTRRLYFAHKNIFDKIKFNFSQCKIKPNTFLKVFISMKYFITENQLRFIMENEEIDRILDKISSDGIESLTIYEKKYLDSYSQHDGNDSEFIDPETRMDIEHEKRSEEITSEIEALNGMTFRYDDRLDLDDDEFEVAGDLMFDDEKYYVMFLTNKSGELLDYSVSKEYLENDTDEFKKELKTKFPNMSEDRLFSMFEYFLEQEVIPNLP
jgi:hypothetical protein